MIWAILILQLIFILFALAYAASAAIGIIFGAPYVGTNKRIAKAMLEFAEVGSQDVVLDIGCGTGNILAAALRERNVRKVIGYDVSPFLVLLARLRLLKFGKEKAELIAKRIQNMAHHEDVTVVTIYLLPVLMNSVMPILVERLPASTRIISHGFSFKGIEPRKTTSIHNATLRLYAMNDLMAAHAYERGSRT